MPTEIENQISSFRTALDSLNEGDTESVREWLVAAIKMLERQHEAVALAGITPIGARVPPLRLEK